MKRLFIIIALVFLIFSEGYAQKKKETAPSDTVNNKSIIKKGFNYGPLPAVAFDADKGLQLGALLNIYDFGDGKEYPNPRQQWYFEASFFTKGSQFYTVTYDTKFLIPGVRFSTGITVVNDKALDFYGFNGYRSYYDYQRVKEGKDNPDSYLYTPYYRVDRLNILFKADFTGEIIKKKFYWEAGYYFSYFKEGAINRTKINKKKSEAKKFPDEVPTLYEQYRQWGIIPDDEDGGGINSIIRLGFLYDTRDVENSPSKGLWIEGHTMLAPKWLGTSNPYYRYSLTFRHYIPFIYKKLTLAYRLNYQGTIGKSAPYYVLPFYSVFGVSFDKDAVGGYRTVRGIMRNRIQALDVGFYNIELRWKFIQFKLWKQNIAFALSAFQDGAIATRGYDMSFKKSVSDFSSEAQYRTVLNDYNTYMQKSSVYGNKALDQFHLSAGAGLRFIMNENFIVAFEYGMPFNKQDGKGAFYINVGYLF
jgi:hypothetical protein